MEAKFTLTILLAVLWKVFKDLQLHHFEVEYVGLLLRVQYSNWHFRLSCEKILLEKTGSLVYIDHSCFVLNFLLCDLVIHKRLV